MPSPDAGIRIVGSSNPVGVYTFRPALARSCKAPKVEKPKEKKRRRKSPSPEAGPGGSSSSKAKPGKKSPKSGKKAKGKKAKKSKAWLGYVLWTILIPGEPGSNGNCQSFGKRSACHTFTYKPLKIFWLTSRKSLAYLQSVCGRSMGNLRSSRWKSEVSFLDYAPALIKRIVIRNIYTYSLAINLCQGMWLLMIPVVQAGLCHQLYSGIQNRWVWVPNILALYTGGLTLGHDDSELEADNLAQEILDEYFLGVPLLALICPIAFTRFYKIW